ncbi:MAG: bifunctional 3,4-dihydroxy-2-butanone-4-phosphate synthase/GTP cyclohydrolase II [Deltaproteobacteria bacterium]|jgi:3,4-dihydroxy 2-butanone 4-phosphate synthase / GTP cyclohydrolase II|nr:bifunctional 3,4-dihydroxy-2-butanone-4-phosphate synthase/GTP cyclohydrolase II [Deltaproteobacteria bacterium]MCK5185875.1 bifunctional 3,4-dihydroxy-2-butanone-4-phosphate synthase/GTP cyclohydrolase II [Deltaproteobacteria bacterium]MCK5422221.1 bifunctional 3,4-dihydroxy-2-butanone-4-phosphate synthase/GTP cyclohydrolase II [Deltaproteobacteria bacterium]
MSVSTIREAIEDIKKGKMVILCDNEDRENEGDLTMAAEKITPEAINFMAKYGRGLICLSLTEEHVEKLKIPLMVEDNTSAFQTAFTVSIDAKEGTTTGISAEDRATTVLTAIADDVKPEDLARPGHIFPLRSKEGGVLSRIGQTEGSVDLARLAGMKSAGVICEIMNDDGTMARMPDLVVFAKEHGLKIITVADLIKYRLQFESLVNRVVTTVIPSTYGGDFKAIIYKNVVDSNQHIALVKGEWSEEDEVLVRVHSECLTGDALGSERCDCGEQLHAAMAKIEKEGRGVIVYMRQEGRGIGFVNKMKAYALQDEGKDTVEANEALGFEPDLRDYGVGAQIIRDLGIRKMRLMTNNPKKIVGLEGYGLIVSERVSIEIKPTGRNVRYLKTKQKKLGHILNFD